MNYCLDCQERYESETFHDCQSLKREFETRLEEEAFQRGRGEAIEKDLKFLKEMYQCSQELINKRYDITTLEHLDKMIEDWKDELEALKKGNQTEDKI